MPKHLLKCRSKWTGGTKTCRFNVTHVVPIPEIGMHEATCSDRLMVEQSVMRRLEKEKAPGGAPKAPAMNVNRVINDSNVKAREDDDWTDVN